MTKITQKGMWIEISSLNNKDKKNYLVSMLFFFLGAFAWGIHLSSIGGLGGEIIPDSDKSLFFNLARLFFVTSWIIAAIFYLKFYKEQDELIQRWHQYILSWGAGGFLICGTLISIASPFFNFNPTFYEFFVAFTIGTVVGAYRFYKKYL